MNLDQLEDLIRRYLSAGVAVVIILAAPVAGAATDGAAPDGAAEASAVRPDTADEVEIRDGTPGATPEDAADPDAADPDAADPDAADPDAADPPDGEPGGPVEEPDVDDRETGEEPAGAEPVEEDVADPERAGSDREAGEAEEDAAGEESRPDDGGDEHDGAATDRGAEPGEPEAGDAPSDDADPDGGVPTEADLEARGPADDGESGLVDVDDTDDAADDAADADTDSGERSAPPGGTSAGATAAERLGWGLPDQADDFRTADLEGWEAYSGPGYDGQGERSPDAVAVRDGVLTITGDAQGVTGGVCWGGGQRYGRWEARLRASAADPAYHALMLLWPDADDFPTGGEIDVVELAEPTRGSAEFYLHFGPDNDQVRSEVQVDATQWHAWAVEWTPEGVTGYLDGEEWFSATDPDTLPPGPMHLCLQLDFFPAGDAEVRPSRMEVDWVRQYALDEATAADERPPSDEAADGDAADGATEREEAADDEPVSVGPAGLWERMFSW